MMHKRGKRRPGSIFLFMLFLAFCAAGSAGASTLVPSQTWLPGDELFDQIKFTQPLPIFGPGYNAALPRVNAFFHPFLEVKMKEIDQVVLPQGTFTFPSVGQVTLGPTRVWAYETRDGLFGKVLGPAHWPSVTIEAQRFIPTKVKYVNELPSFNAQNMYGPPFVDGLVQGLVTVDQSIHWANPLGNTGMMMCMNVDCTVTPDDPCCRPYTGPVPAVAHLHGGETRSAFDGGPEQWFTPNGLKGKDYRTLDNPGPGKAIYYYDNIQEPGTLWFHDHGLGVTRTNVYSGLATFYFIRDAKTEPRNLPSGAYEIEMGFQDRQFDTTGQLFWPDGSGNPDSNLNGKPPNPDMHPFWIPEFIGDVAIVNGTPWPVLQVEPRRYLFRMLDGSNARFYNLTLGTVPLYQVGGDDNYLDRPVPINSVFIAPGERAYVIADFTGHGGETITVANDAPVPFPMGLVPGDPNQVGMASIMQFQVTLPLNGTDTSCNPALGQCTRPLPMVRLADGQGHVARGVKIEKKRQLVLKEVQGLAGPIEVLVNNTKWDGLFSPNIAAFFAGTEGISELPRVGSTELWEIINLTMDAHPMHTHLVQFQVLDRQFFNNSDVNGYLAAWNAAFGDPSSAPLPTGCNPGQFCPGYGPPLPYNAPNMDGGIGGNPAVSPYLLGIPAPPAPEESGWKDTAKVLPSQVMRILVRWTPTSIPNLLAAPGRNLYPFDPTDGPGYVWHCHIVDHEDNEMMRPYKVVK